MTKESIGSAETTTTQEYQSLKNRLRNLVTSWLTPKYTEPKELSNVAPILQQGREHILFAMVRIISACGVLLWLLYFFSSFIKSPASVIVFVLLMLLFCAMSHEKVNYTTRCIGTGVGIYLGGIGDLLFYGVWYAGPLFLLILVLYTLIFAGTRIGLAVIALCAASIAAVATVNALGIYTPPLNYFAPDAFSISNAVMWPAIFSLTALLALVITSSLIQFVESAWQREHATTLALMEKTTELNVSLEREQELAAALKVSLNKEISLNQLRSKVITTISHEFRTPLTVINTSADLLKLYAERLTEQKRDKQFDRIKTAVTKLDQLLGQVTSIEEIERTNLEEYVTLPFGVLSAEIAQFIRQQFGHIDYIHIEFDPLDLTTLTVERMRINQLCQIVVSNAVKFGSTHVAIKIERQQNALIITVEDNGIGIPPDEIDGLFSPFQRGSNAETYQGLGIGLSIAHNLIASLKGSLTLESDETTVATINIPLDSADSQSDAPPLLAQDA